MTTSPMRSSSSRSLGALVARRVLPEGRGSGVRRLAREGRARRRRRTASTFPPPSARTSGSRSRRSNAAPVATHDPRPGSLRAPSGRATRVPHDARGQGRAPRRPVRPGRACDGRSTGSTRRSGASCSRTSPPPRRRSGSRARPSETIGPLRAAHKIHEQSLARDGEALVGARDAAREAPRRRRRQGRRARSGAHHPARARRPSSRTSWRRTRSSRPASRQAPPSSIPRAPASTSCSRRAASLLGTTSTSLTGPSSGGARTRRRAGARSTTVEVRASAPGIVEALAVTNGAWVEQSSLVLSTVQPERLRFARARAPERSHGSQGRARRAVIAPPRRARRATLRT